MVRISLIFIISLVFSGCSSLLPSVESKTATSWESYEAIDKSYCQVKNYETSKKELHKLGFDPHKTSNTKILNHLDIMKKFLVNQSIKIKDLDEGLQVCLKNEESCIAYETQMKYIKRKRYGSVLADLFNFRKNTRETGWSFSSIIVLSNDLVVFKTASSQPKIDNKENKKNPLGPFQSMESVLRAAVK